MGGRCKPAWDKVYAASWLEICLAQLRSLKPTEVVVNLDVAKMVLARRHAWEAEND